MGTPPPRKKLLHLQGIRGLAILAVTLFHFFPLHFSNGYLGVDIFFALSGYLMTMMLSQVSKLRVADVVDFLYRRIKRIVPLYYLCTLLTLVVLNYSDSMTLKMGNIYPAMNAVAFVTNLIQPNNMGGYFEKLGLAVDLFTHTWSLSVEMQFYLLFPAIFVIYGAFPYNSLSQVYLAMNSLFSFLYYACCDELTSFNSVFARIWQFNAGMMVYNVLNPPQPSDSAPAPFETVKLLERGSESGKSLNSPAIYSLFILLSIVASPQAIYPHFGRVLAIVITMQLFQQGEGCLLLENRILVHIGEISYAWYLVHWPFASYCRLTKVEDNYHLLAVYIVTFIVAELLHFAFERFFLNWEKITIGGLVLCLLMANGMAIYTLKLSIPAEEKITAVGLAKESIQQKLKTSFNWPSDFMAGWRGGYEDLSKGKRINLNNNYQAMDLERSLLWKYCKKFEKTNSTIENWCIFNEGLNSTSPLRLLVVGNSYASNLFPIIFDECKNNFSHMEITFCGECEVLAQTNDGRGGAYYNCSQDYIFLEAVKRVQPDVLFIIQRMFKMEEIVNGTNPFDDHVFQTASERLTDIQKYVKKKIFILDDFPETGIALSSIVDYLKDSNATIPKMDGQSFRNTIARMRIQRLASECRKCKVFDYTPQFFFNGQFMFYDPKYYVAFLTMGRHLTPAGQERVRPVVKHLCDTL